ncbi:MAG: DUF1501 domain-containing protein [Planctomycetota bacterium]
MLNEQNLPLPCSVIRETPRRGFLRAGVLTACGLSLPQFFRLRARGADVETPGRPREQARCDSVIQIYLPGGIAHQEWVDPKPAAPVEYRGEMGSIRTSLDDIRFNELMTSTARIADRLAIIRSMTHTEAAHPRGTHNMITGYRPSAAIVYPSIGSVISHELGPLNELPPYVCVPNLSSPYSGPGYLSSAYGPFTLGSDPARRSFEVRDLALPSGVDAARFERRKDLIDLVDHGFKAGESSMEVEAMRSFYERAYAVLDSPRAKAAFDIRSEPEAIRERYGKGTAGARMLMARRLIEAGVRFVSMSYGAWDTHTYHFRTSARQLPPLDQAFGALIDDLDERGMLERTLVVVCTEFGRTPMVNAGAGRDHWPRVFSTILAGGGLRRGLVYGASDAIAAEPADHPVSPEDLAKTIYHLLGVSAEKELMAPGDRPLEIVDGGRVIRELLA